MDRLTQPQTVDHGTVGQLLGSLCVRYRFFGSAPIGNSVLGRPIRCLTFGSGPQCVLMAAAFHGQEWLTALICLRLCEEIGEALLTGERLAGWDIRRALRDRRIVWVPLVNPDGVEIAVHGSASAGEYADLVRDAGGDVYGCWQANARGVDINHNFNAGWHELQQAERENGIIGPCARQWGGTRPMSEPETQVLVNLCDRISFRHVMALHSQGEEIYWHYGEHTPPESRLMASVMASVSGYTVATPSGLASHGGFKDWFIEAHGKPGFTVELGKGTNPLPITEFEDVYQKARELLVISLLI
ncbi:MAG: M14 family metallocarboxypeptidase [Clostridia bacterium]|nr:M14 family metallocarboxypeptidase [Clostridia bacterium]